MKQLQYHPKEYAGNGYATVGWVVLRSVSSLNRTIDFTAGLEMRDVLCAMKASEIRNLFVCASCLQLLDQHEGILCLLGVEIVT